MTEAPDNVEQAGVVAHAALRGAIAAMAMTGMRTFTVDLGLVQAKRARPLERAALALDHLLYGFVLSELRSQPRE